MKKLMIIATIATLSAGAASASTSGGWFSTRGYSPIHEYMKSNHRIPVVKVLEHFRGYVGCDHCSVKEPPARPVSDVPLPAAGFLLLGGLGGFALMRRRRKTA